MAGERHAMCESAFVVSLGAGGTVAADAGLLCVRATVFGDKVNGQPAESNNSDYLPIQHKLIGFYNRDGVLTARYELDT